MASLPVATAVLTLLAASPPQTPAASKEPAKKPAAAKPTVQRWSLERFEKEALKRNLAIREALENVRLATAKRMEAAWARFPRFEWTSVASPIPSLRGNAVTTTTPTNQFVGFDGMFQQHKLDVFLPLFTFGKLRNAKKAAQWGIRAAEHDVRRARAEVKRLVRKAFWSVKVASAVLKIIHEGWQRLNAAEKRLMEFLEKGTKEVEELDRNRLAVFSAEVAHRREQAIHFEKLSHYALRVAAGLDQNAPIEAARSRLVVQKVALKPLRELLAIAEARRPELKALDAAIGARRAVVDLRKSFYYPDLFIAGTVGVARCNVCDDQSSPFAFDPFNIDLYGAALGLRLTFDYGQKVAKVRQAEAKLRRLVAQRNRAREGIRLQVRNAYLNFIQVKKQKRIVTKGRKAAQGWLFQATINFNTGLARFKDLTDALKEWFKFRLRELQAVYAYNVAAADLSYAVGEDVPRVSE